MYPAGVATRATVYDTCARMELWAFPDPLTSLRERVLVIHDAIHDPKNLAYASTHPRAVMGSHKRSAGVLADHDDVDEVVKKAGDAKRKTKNALERAAKAKR